jgi:hypothetical protein
VSIFSVATSLAEGVGGKAGRAGLEMRGLAPPAVGNALQPQYVLLNSVLIRLPSAVVTL